jgi:hypothetical protein
MDDNHPRKFLRGSLLSILRSKPGCPEEQQLAGYVDQRLSSTVRQSIEFHLGDCQRCRSQVAFLSDAVDWPEPTAVPAQLLSKAVAMVPGANAGWRTSWRWTTALAAASGVLLAVVLGLAVRFWRSEALNEQPLVAQTNTSQPLPAQSPNSADKSDSSTTQSRNVTAEAPSRQKPPKALSSVRSSASADAAAPRLISPHEGGLVNVNEVIVSWSPVSSAKFYEATVVSEAGDQVYQAKTEEMQLRLPPEVKLVRGAKYFVWVSAVLGEGKTAKSNLISFRTK